MYLETIMLSVIRQSQKTIYSMISLDGIYPAEPNPQVDSTVFQELKRGVVDIGRLGGKSDVIATGNAASLFQGRKCVF